MIRGKPVLIVSATALAVLGFAAIAANAPPPIGITAAVLNRVTIARGAAAQVRPAVLRQQIALADRVETGARSQLQILLLDRSTFTIGANARLTIDRFVYDPASGRSVSASVAKGAFRFMSGRPSRGGSSSITTPVASIGIRGTIVDGVVGADAIAIASGERGAGSTQNADPQTATLVILRGPGGATRGNVIPGAITVSAGGKSVSLDRPLLAVFVPRPGAQPSGPFAISLSGLTRVQGLIFPSLAQWRVATRPAPSGVYVVPPARQVRRARPVLDGDPAEGGAFDAGSPGGMVPGYGAGLPSMPSRPAHSGSTRQERVPATEATPAADPVQTQSPAPPPADPAPTPTPTPNSPVTATAPLNAPPPSPTNLRQAPPRRAAATTASDTQQQATYSTSPSTDQPPQTGSNNNTGAKD